MGGNVVINGQKAEKIPSSFRNELVPDIEKLFCFLNANEALVPAKIFAEDLASGSTAFIYNDRITQDQLDVFKPFFGDLDYQIDINKLDLLKARLDKLMEAGSKHGKFELYGYKQTTNTVVTLWHYKGINVQIDFEGVEFEGDLPSAWSTFAYSASWQDTIAGIKGVAHKYIFRALTARWLGEYTLESGKTVYTSTMAFSNKGLRQKLVPVSPGIWRELKRRTDEIKYITDIDSILEILFSKLIPIRVPTLYAQQSFVGMVGMIEKYLVKEDWVVVADGMANLLWGKDAQRIYSNDFEDQVCKQKMMLHMSSTLNIPHNRWDDMIHSYYG